MDDRELDLDALEKVARAALNDAGGSDWRLGGDGHGYHWLDLGFGTSHDVSAWNADDCAHIATFDPPTVLKLIALARPKAGGVEAQGDDKKFGDGTPDGFFITFADGSTSFEFTEEDRDEALADALPGAKWDAVYKRAAAPEPLRVAGEEVERLRNEIERLEADATVEDIVVAGLKPERDKFDAGERSNLNTRFVRGSLDAEAIANARLIAAAPELLEALRYMVRDHPRPPMLALAAIAKALGQ